MKDIERYKDEVYFHEKLPTDSNQLDFKGSIEESNNEKVVRIFQSIRAENIDIECIRKTIPWSNGDNRELTGEVNIPDGNGGFVKVKFIIRGKG